MATFRICLVALAVVFAFLPVPAEAGGRVLRVAFDKELPPFSSVDSHGEATGFTIDLMEGIARHHGWELEYVPLDWEDAVNALKSGEVDVVLGMKYTSRYDEVFDFSESFFTMSEVLLVPREDESIHTLNQLSEKVVAVQRGHSSMDLLESVRRVKMNISFSQVEALNNLLRGRADAFIGNRWTAEYHLRQMNRLDDFEMRSGMINPTDYSFAVREGHTELLDALNEGLNFLYREGTYSRLYSQYFEPYSPHLLEWWRKLVAGLLAALTAGAVSLALFYLWNKRLKAEVKRQTAALADAMEFQRKVLDNTENGIFSLDVDTRITLVNEVAKRLLSLREEVLGRRIASVLPQLPLEPDLAVSNDSRMEGEMEWGTENRRIFHYYIAPLFNAQHEHAGWIVTLQDRTEHKRMQARLIDQEKMRALGQLVAGIAHEMRNPLTAMKAFIEVLPKKVDDPRFRTELLRYVPEEMERLNRIVEDLLDYSRTRPLMLQKIKVDELFRSVLVLFARRLEKERVHLVRQVEGDLYLQADTGRVKQVLINLLINAMEAMSSNVEKKLLLRAWEESGELCISVTDNGEGIREEQLDSLFEPFYTSKSQGIGLGLYLSRKIMREHGGSIDVQSRYGEGTTFTLRFPQPGGERGPFEQEMASRDEDNFRLSGGETCQTC